MKKKITLLLFLVATLSVFAQEEIKEIEKKEATEKKFSFTGSVDAYFRTNLNAPMMKTL